MFWPGGWFALELTTSTPDALCPPLEEARAAVRSRVGDVRGSFEARYALIRADDGRPVLDLIVMEGQERVLHRELPLDAAGCQDAAQAIALVLERYFDAVEPPEPPPPLPELEPVPATVSRPAHNAAARADRESPPAGSYRLALGGVLDAELGFAPNVALGVYPAALRLPARLAFGFELAFTPFLRTHTERVRSEEVAQRTLQGSLFVPVELARAWLRAAIGPWAQLRWQRAEAPSLANEQAASRWLGGLGGATRLGFSPWSSWTASLGFAAGAQLGGSAERFSLRRSSGDTTVVLIPQSWFAQGELRLSFEL